AKSEQQQSQSGCSHAPCWAHAHSSMEIVGEPVFPASAHCSPILKEFFQSHFARGFFFIAHLNNINLTAKRCLSVGARANFKRKFQRGVVLPTKDMRNSKRITRTY